ncbi:right-handed parallel beta-helix repeat-containing protein [Ktedonospora formicarum]|nr:right-handed parallel beta-helix repeat-containing protein [Ktedonospora formicarum]
MEASTRFCDQCGATNRSDARFCYSCGQPQMVHASTATGLLTTSHQLKQRYTILEKLGQGGFGAVYKMEDTLFGNAIRAVKEMGMRGLDPQETREAIASFKHEAQLLASLNHPHLPRIYDHFEERGRWYLVMDYIEGETLDKRLASALDGKLPLTDAIQIGLQLCDVLDYLHAHQPPIVFRDLKPDNVMLAANDHLYLIDFGIARFFKPGQAKDTISLGTPGYASPEQYGRMQTTIRSDIYSLGATLHHAITGINPGSTPFLFQPLDLDTQSPGNAELEALITQMLEMKEAKRPQDAHAVAEELRNIQRLRANRQGFAPPLGPRPHVTMKLQETLVVSQEGDGDYTSISEAIEHATPGTLVMVRAGVYSEHVLLDRDVQIIGNGPREQIILESQDQHTITIRTEHASISGLTIRCQVGEQGESYNALHIPEGELFIENCEISSESSTCVAIYGEGTRPTIRYCNIYYSPASGIAVYQKAEGIIEYCDISGHAQHGLYIAEDGNPTLRHCTLHYNQQHGLLVQDWGRGTLEDCELHHNAKAAAAIVNQGSPLLLRCKLHHNEGSGLEIQQKGRGSFQDCDIFANAGDNVRITTGGTPYLYLCKIHDGQGYGVAIEEQGLGIIEYCDIFANAHANVLIASSGEPNIRYCKIREGLQSGIVAITNGRGTIERCTITGNAHQPLNLAPESQVVLNANVF